MARKEHGTGMYMINCMFFHGRNSEGSLVTVKMKENRGIDSSMSYFLLNVYLADFSDAEMLVAFLKCRACLIIHLITLGIKENKPTFPLCIHYCSPFLRRQRGEICLYV